MPDAPFRLIGDPDAALGPFLLSCEHASNAMGDVLFTEADRSLLDDHWGWDPGAAAMTEHLAARFDSAAVLSHFSRLLIDPNRPLDSATLFVSTCAGQPVSFNQDLTDADRQARIDGLYRPYHAALRDAAQRRMARGPITLLSMHSFTPDFTGQPRPMEIGVLFDDGPELGARLARALEAEGFAVALNAPYSGRDGFMYCIEHHGRALSLPRLELEVRQDLLRTPEAVASVSERIGRALEILT